MHLLLYPFSLYEYMANIWQTPLSYIKAIRCVSVLLAGSYYFFRIWTCISNAILNLFDQLELFEWIQFECWSNSQFYRFIIFKPTSQMLNHTRINTMTRVKLFIFTISFHAKYFNKILPWKNKEKGWYAIRKRKMNNLTRVIVFILVWLSIWEVGLKIINR